MGVNVTKTDTSKLSVTDDFYKFYKNSKFCARKSTPHFKKIHPSYAMEGYFLLLNIDPSRG